MCFSSFHTTEEYRDLFLSCHAIIFYLVHLGSLINVMTPLFLVFYDSFALFQYIHRFKVFRDIDDF